jgi:NAD-dependent histone deacetylase SIR2
MDGSEIFELSGGEIIAKTDGMMPPRKKRRVAHDQHLPAVQIDLGHQDNATSPPLQRLLEALHRKKKIVVVAGAGISVSAGSMSFSFISTVARCIPN